jgi:hypothetical protein
MALLKTNPPKIQTLEEKISQLRDELDAEIDRRAAELKKTMEGVPVTVIRNILTRSSPCQCDAYIRIKDSEA